jgi:S1-C subfamily serine protease
MSRKTWLGWALVGPCLLLLPPAVRAQEQRSSRASLGVLIAPALPDARQQGAVVRDVQAGSAAEKAGIKAGDVITRVGDKDVRDPETLVRLIADHKPGDKLSFTVLRDGKDHKLDVALGRRRSETAGPRTGPYRNVRPSAFLGVQAVPLDAAGRPSSEAKVDHGVAVTEVVANTPADKAGLKVGDVITDVNGKAVRSLDDLRDAVRRAGVGKEITIKAARGKGMKELHATLEEAPGDIFFDLPRLNPRLAGVPQPRFGPSNPADQQRIQELEREVQRLRERVRELEQKRSPQPNK